MDAEEIVLNIAVNMGRIGRFASEGRGNRVKQFLLETQEYLGKLGQATKSERFMPTYNRFKTSLESLSRNIRLDEDWAEDAFTWANILTHRAKLAS